MVKHSPRPKARKPLLFLATPNLKQKTTNEKRETRNEQRTLIPAVPAHPALGTCPSCIKASKLIHPDIHFSFPVIPKKSGDKPVSTDYIVEWRLFIEKNPYGNSYDWLQFIDAENKQGNITAHECNEIIRMMSLKSFEAEYKILIMWMPEMLGKEGNKLLKLIEEPPPNTLFIFVAENDDLILRSRKRRPYIAHHTQPYTVDKGTPVASRRYCSGTTAAARS